jgi:hypothetical protein
MRKAFGAAILVGMTAEGSPQAEGSITADQWRKYFEVQADSCLRDGSPLYGALIRRVGEDHASGGIVADLLDGWQGNPILQAVAMRMMGAVHHLVLAGDAPKLARHYPSAGGTPSYPDVADVFIATLREHREFVAKRLGLPVQTNEVRRSAALLGGFLQVAASTRLPLRVLEIGASAGLNQLWDRYRYALGPHRWGDPQAEPLLTTDWQGPPPALDAPLQVASRHACDLSPLDLSDTESRHHLETFIWPDQPERRERFNRATDAVLAAGVEIDRSAALPWLADRLAQPVVGVATVLFHSVVWHYIDPEEQEGIVALMERVGEASDANTPLAWLRMEPRSFANCELRLRVWPGGEDQLLGTCGSHGQYVKWNS